MKRCPITPLYDRGLGFYGVYRVESSSSASGLLGVAIKKSAKPFIRPERTHFIVTMQDSTFECVAEGVSFEMHPERLADVAAAVFRDFADG